MVRAVRAKVRANKKYEFGPGENTILVQAKNTILVQAKKNTILVRAKIRFWSGRKYFFGPGEISPGHEFYKKYDFAPGENMMISPGHEVYV